MDARDASQVARRTLCLELLLQRIGLELADSVPVAERDKLRTLWLARLGELGIEGELLADERAWFERPIGALSEDDLDDLHARMPGALALLWALGRLPTRPDAASVDRISELLDAHGLLGDGSISRAREAAQKATLRDRTSIQDACADCEHLRGKARETDDPEKIVAEIVAHHLAWVLDPTMTFD